MTSIEKYFSNILVQYDGDFGLRRVHANYEFQKQELSRSNSFSQKKQPHFMSKLTLTFVERKIFRRLKNRVLLTTVSKTSLLLNELFFRVPIKLGRNTEVG